MINEGQLRALGMTKVYDSVSEHGSEDSNSGSNPKKCASPLRIRKMISGQVENLVDYCEKVYPLSKTEKCWNSESRATRFLWNEHLISASLEDGDYIPALQDIQSSGGLTNKIRNVKSLMAKHGVLHAPFMYELSLLLYQNASKENKALTLQRICWPLIGAAVFRTVQDSHCSIKSVQSRPYATKIQEVYINQMFNLIKKDLGKDEIPPEFNLQKRSKEIQEAVLKVATQTLSIDVLPNPVWIEGRQSKNILPEEDRKKLRDQYANFVINTIEKAQIEKTHK